MSDSPDCQCASDQEKAAREAMIKEFPCLYMFKAVGYNADGFMEDVFKACQSVLGQLDEKENLRTRASKNDRYLAVTVEAPVQSYEIACQVYEAIRKVQGLVTLF